MYHHILLIPTVLATSGFIVSTNSWITFVNNLSSCHAIILRYFVIIMLLLILRKMGVTIREIEFDTIGHVIGSVLIIFSFFIIFNFSSCYYNELLNGECYSVPELYLASEDGIVYNFWKRYTKNTNNLRILTYMVTPFLLTLIGIFLIQKKISLPI
jgi:hypothetical protein